LVDRYEERIDRVETRITARLRDQLGTARNANEMFRIFSRFNALFVRPHIRGAIREYQTQLIQRVKDDIESLHEKFKVLPALCILLQFSVFNLSVIAYLKSFSVNSRLWNFSSCAYFLVGDARNVFFSLHTVLHTHGNVFLVIIWVGQYQKGSDGMWI